jgi:hypothetical protein
MYSAQGDTALPVPGFPIRVPAGQSLFSGSPRLIAAVHALHRLLVPRHPPCALTILTVIVDNYDARRRRGYNGDLSVVEQRASRPLLWPCCAVFKVRRGRNRRDSPAGLSKLSSTPGLVDVLDAPRRPEGLEAGSHCELPRKEVIQPHLPVRLPCYDFTPITSPTFDGSLPEGWVTGFGCCPLSWCDGRCVQDPGTYSPRRC